MESEHIIDSLTVYTPTQQNLIVTTIYFFASHYTHIFQVFASISKLAKAFCSNIGTTDINFFQKLKLGRYKFGSSIIYFCATQEV